MKNLIKNLTERKNNMSQYTVTTEIDVRFILPRERHSTIFRTFDSLKIGEALHLIVDHPPRPLYYEFLHERPELFSWTYLEEGPALWRVEIAKVAEAAS